MGKYPWSYPLKSDTRKASALQQFPFPFGVGDALKVLPKQLVGLYAEQMREIASTHKQQRLSAQF